MTPRPPSEVSDARLREIRTLEEAYSAVERLTRERDEATARVNQFQRADQISHERAEKAERELSEARLALIVLRDAIPYVESIGTPEAARMAVDMRAALSPPCDGRAEAEREAERAVVRAARRWVDSLQAAGKRYGVHYTGSPEYQYVADALAALPASPSDKEDT
jgi:hypothetical protein